MMVEDRGGRGPEALQAATVAMMGRANQEPGLRQVFTLFETSTPQLYLDIDRAKAELLGINVADVFTALQVYIGSAYVNDFNLFGRTFRVTAQADAAVPRGCARRAQPAGPQQPGRHRAARLVHDRAQHFRAVPGAALQPLSRRRARRHRGARLFAGPGDRDHGEARRRGAARRLRATSGRRSRSSRSGPAAPRASPSGSPWCSCSWCSPRSTRA